MNSEFNYYENLFIDVDSLSNGEKTFASMFSDKILTSSINDLQIISTYLRACDYMGVIFSLSKSLRKMFKTKVLVTPGLFKSSYCDDYNTRLHPHQVVSLNYMTEMENCTSEFNVLRGGVFADEPGYYICIINDWFYLFNTIRVRKDDYFFGIDL